MPVGNPCFTGAHWLEAETHQFSGSHFYWCVSGLGKFR